MPEIEIRPLTRSDRAAVGYELRHLSERSLYQRYLRVDERLPRRESERITDVDHWHHEGLIAFSRAPRVPVGVVEYVRLAEFDEAELAISVVEGWQGRGIGRQLALALTSRARAAGIRRFRATIMRGNRGALALARALGRCTPVHAEGNTVEWRIDL